MGDGANGTTGPPRGGASRRKRGRTLLHLAMADDLVDALDAVATRRGTSRTALIDAVLRADPAVAAELVAADERKERT